MIKLVDFSKTYGSGKNSFAAVEHVTFSAEQGCVTALLGPNGAGKTTILRAVCGLHYASSGHVFVSGNDGTMHDSAVETSVVKGLVGFVPEQALLPKELTVAELLEECADVRGLYAEDKKKSIIHVVEECSLEQVYTKKIGTLSKGFCQRVSFAQALVADPPDIVLDEPVSGLDPAQIVQIRSLIKRISLTKTVLLSTHILHEVGAICSTVVILSHGKLVASGVKETVIKSCGEKNLEEAFLRLTGEVDV
ncbi:MAG: ABC transporter ATP-binding protein [Treponema sp.]|nr:ABC transporter ATP-binding protein [Treponema sp.]